MLRHWLRLPRGTFFLHFLITFFINGCLVPVVGANEFFLEANDKEILDFLLHKSNYDKRVKPDTKHDGPVVVDLSVVILSLSSPDESSLKYEVDFLLHARWMDPRLEHDDKFRYPYLCAMTHLNDIWLPQIFFIKHGDFKDPLHPENVMTRVYRNGTVEYTRRRYLNLNCEGNLDVFPFDDPVCEFFMESKTYEGNDVVLVWRNDTQSNQGKHLVSDDSLKELNAYLIFNETKQCSKATQYSWRGNFSCLQVSMTFSRDDSFYFSTVFIPSIILVTSSFITFWLEWNAVPARVMIGVTTMLNFFTTSNSFRSTLPVVSNLAAMNLWDSVCMFFIYVSLLEFVVVNYVGRKRPKQNMSYMPGENAVIQVLSENRHAERKRSSGDTNHESPEGDMSTNKNSHEIPSCANCGNSQCSHANAPIACPDEENIEISQVEYSFNKPRKKDPTHPIRIAKSIDVVSRLIFPLGYSIFLLYFFGTYMGFRPTELSK